MLKRLKLSSSRRGAALVRDAAAIAGAVTLGSGLWILFGAGAAFVWGGAITMTVAILLEAGADHNRSDVG